MTGIQGWLGAKAAVRLAVACFAALMVLAAAAAPAAAETRSLKLYYIHTKEKAEIVFKRNGRYDQAGLTKLNRFLRDWRRNEPTKMDPRLFDILWEVYRQAGARDYIHVVSAYRSPATNDMLRRTRGGQAEKSQHMVGKAIDFFIPGVKLSKVREIAFKLQGGGVGYYPKSGSPFVHLDTGNVRAWPRMSRTELVRLFPDGKTLHLPADGKPLPGYNQAMAEYKARKASGNLVASASRSSSSRTVVAEDDGNKPTLLGMLFGGGADEEEDNAEQSVAAPAPAKPKAQPVPEPAAPAVAAPAPQPEPVPAEPDVLVAALPTNNAPVPTPAPRAAPEPVAVAEAVMPADVPVPAEPLPTVGDDVLAGSETVVAVAVPRPTPRPAYTPVAPALETEAELLARLDAVGGGDDARKALRDALGLGAEETPAGAPIVTALVPVNAAVPVPRPEAPSIAAAPEVAPSGKGGRLIVPEPRPEVAAVPAPKAPAGAIGEKAKTGVKTTAKAAKPKGLSPTKDFNVEPLPASSSRFGPSSAQSALKEPVATAPAFAFSRDNGAKSGTFSGKAVSFETTAGIGN